MVLLKFCAKLILIEIVSHVSDMAYGPLVEYFTINQIYEY